MFKKSALVAFMVLAACAQSQPRVIQTVPGTPEITVTVGLATQIEMPDAGRVQSITVGNPTLLSAEQAGDVVNLSAKDGAGQTNLIIRARDEDGHLKVYQYHVTVQSH
jgi:hypothetical protein